MMLALVYHPYQWVLLHLKSYIPVGPPFATAGLGVLLLHDFERDFLAASASFNLTMQHWGLGLQALGCRAFN